MIVLVDNETAKAGYEFVYCGEGDECRDCKFKLPCHSNLEAGRRYVVTEIKKQVHPCQLFGEVRVADVNESSFEVTIKRGNAIEGASTTYNPLKCENSLCENYSICCPDGLDSLDRCVVEKIISKVDCEKLGALEMVRLRRV